ncbi:hypothetical protein L1049_014850 [Liquidambar formosana]|uniref:Sorting nexin C-terminal domain-containing protein n=1 Tax=Liquidambar formosana TaxID=63359 RepID=A0AAP0RXX3_LIQFO
MTFTKQNASGDYILHKVPTTIRIPAVHWYRWHKGVKNRSALLMQKPHGSRWLKWPMYGYTQNPPKRRRPSVGRARRPMNHMAYLDKIFQLKRRGWLRRQVFWISKQILQLMMEDAIDDWLLRQIHWLRRDDIIAQGIRWVQDVLWPDGKFFLRLTNTQSEIDDTPLNQRTLQTTSHIVGSNLSKAGVSFL